MFSFGNLPKPQGLIGRLRIKSQILIISFLFSIVILGILLGAVLISQQYISQALQDSSNNIFRAQTQVYMNYVWIHQHGMEEVIATTKHHLSTVRKLNNYVQVQQSKQKSFNIPKPKMCLLNSSDTDSYCFNNSMCCGVFGTPLNLALKLELENIMITTSLIDVLRPEYDFYYTSPISFSYNNSAQYYCFATGFAFPSTFKPHTRPYYLETLEKMQNSSNPEEYYYASPYTVLTGRIRCPITTALLDLNKNFIGLIAKDLDFNYTSIEKPNLQNITKYIIAQDGKVVFSDKYGVPSQPVFYLNESQQSGFNQQDYEQIMLKHQGKEFQSNCDNFQFENVLCRYNNIMRDNVIVRTVNITTSPYILVILSQTNEIKQQESIHIQILNQQLRSLILWSTILIVIISTGIIILGQVITNVILRQLNHFIDRIEKLLHENYLNFMSKKSQNKWKSTKSGWIFGDQQFILNTELFSQNVIQSNCVTNLQTSLVNLFRSLNNGKKCDECRIQENLPYPRVERAQQKNTKGIRHLILFIKNDKNQAKKTKTNIFFQLLKGV